MRIRGRLWIRLLLVLAALRLYPAVRRLLIRSRINADLLVECGDHDGGMRFRDLPWRETRNGMLVDVRPGTLDD